MLEKITAAAARCATLFITVCCLAACGGGGPSSSATSTSASTATSVNLTLFGTPATSVVAGSTYSFQPTASPNGGAVIFSITGMPAWATFNPNTGGLNGSPTAADEGTTRAITITASESGRTASIGPFTVDVTAPAAPPPVAGSATLTWSVPAENTDGTPLTDLAGYTIRYGTQAGAMNQTISVPSATTVSYKINNLAPGTYYFEVIAFSSVGAQSVPSNMAIKTI